MEKQCLAIDTRYVNNLGSGKFRTRTDSNQEKMCYYNRNKRDTNFHCFQQLENKHCKIGDIIFSITKLIDKTNKNKDIYLEIQDELSDFN